MALGFTLKKEPASPPQPDAPAEVAPTPTQPAPDPTPIQRFQASVLTYRMLGEAWQVLAERIANGTAKCKAWQAQSTDPRQPAEARNKARESARAGYALLNQLKQEQAELQLRLDDEAERQYRLEREIVAEQGGAAVCTSCWTPFGAGHDCDCYADAVRCARCNRAILDSVVAYPTDGHLVTLTAARIVEITRENRDGQAMCIACYRAGEQRA